MRFQYLAILSSVFIASYATALPQTGEQSDLLARGFQGEDSELTARDVALPELRLAARDAMELAERQIEELKEIVRRDRNAAIQNHKQWAAHHEGVASQHLANGNMDAFHAHNTAKVAHSNAAKGLKDKQPGAAQLSSYAHQTTTWANGHV